MCHRENPLVGMHRLPNHRMEHTLLAGTMASGRAQREPRPPYVSS